MRASGGGRPQAFVSALRRWVWPALVGAAAAALLFSCSVGVAVHTDRHGRVVDVSALQARSNLADIVVEVCLGAGAWMVELRRGSAMPRGAGVVSTGTS